MNKSIQMTSTTGKIHYQRKPIRDNALSMILSVDLKFIVGNLKEVNVFQASPNKHCVQSRIKIQIEYKSDF